MYLGKVNCFVLSMKGDSNLFFNLKKTESIRRIKSTLKNLLTDNFHVRAYVGED